MKRPRLSAHLSTLFTELPPLERPAAAAAAGFEAVESWWPGDAEAGAWAAAVRSEGLELACLNADGGDLAAGDRGFLNVGARREEVVAAVARALALRPRHINVLAGRLVPGQPRASQRDTAAATLRECAALVEGTGTTLVIEPINDHDVAGYLVPTAAAAIGLISAAGSAAVRLLYDAHHAARMGADPVREAPGLVEWIGHVQYADTPGRGAPGTGDVSLGALLDALAQAGYEGAVGLEYAPAGPTLESLAFMGATTCG